MNGPEHYKRAEEALAVVSASDPHKPGLGTIIAIAQLEATLALVAAVMTADRMDPGYAEAWCEVLGYPAPYGGDDD